MLIHVRHADQGELMPESLLFRFEAASFLKRFSLQGEDDGNSSGIAAAHRFHVGRGEKRFAQLPPAAGYSFAFSIAEAIREEVKIVISPLSSLSRPPDTPLHVQSPAAALSEKGFYTDVTVGKVRLLYISPESLNSIRFLEDLGRILGNAPVNALIVDKVHCISEWGGEFMPAYLRIPQLTAHLGERSPRMCFIALTAVPGQKLREDILTRIDFTRDITPSVTPPEIRPGISFQDINVGNQKEKETAWRRLMNEEIPELLADEGIYDIRPMDKPCPDAYRILENRQGEPSPGEQSADVWVVTHPEAEDGNFVQVIFRTALGESMRRWLFRAVNAAASGARVHCVRITDLPDAACEADFHRRRSRVPACRDDACPFGRASLCDYGRHHHFIQHRHPDLRVSLENAWRVLARMLENHDDGAGPLTIANIPSRRSDIELALYRMSVLGMIDQFQVDYAHETPVYQIFGFDPETPRDRCRRNILDYLRRHDTSLARIYQSYTLDELTGDSGEIARDRDRFGEAIREWFEALSQHLPGCDTHRPLFEMIGDYFQVLIRFVQEEIRKAEYMALWNLKEWIRSPGCRTRALLQTVRAAADDWRCHSCDRCGMTASASSFEPPPSLDALTAACSRWLEDDTAFFDSTEAEQLLQTGAENAICLMHRVHALAEERPRHIKALYVAAELASDDLKRIWIKDLLRTACRDLPWRQAVRLYETLTDGDPDLFDLFDAAYGPLATPAADHWRYRESERVSDDPDRKALLGARMVLNILETQDWFRIHTRLQQRIKEIDGDPPLEP